MTLGADLKLNNDSDDPVRIQETIARNSDKIEESPDLETFAVQITL